MTAGTSPIFKITTHYREGERPRRVLLTVNPEFWREILTSEWLIADYSTRDFNRVPDLTDSVRLGSFLAKLPEDRWNTEQHTFEVEELAKNLGEDLAVDPTAEHADKLARRLLMRSTEWFAGSIAPQIADLLAR